MSTLSAKRITACNDVFVDANAGILHRCILANMWGCMRLWPTGSCSLPHNLQQSVQSVPDELVVIQEGCVFDQTEALLHSVDKGLDLQVGHLVQWEEADASEYVQQVAGLQVESLQILEMCRCTSMPKITGDGPETQEKERRKGLVYMPMKCLFTVQ